MHYHVHDCKLESKSFWQFIWQDSDCEEAQNGNAGDDEDFLYSANATLNNRPTYEYLDAMAKAFNEVDLLLAFKVYQTP